IAQERCGHLWRHRGQGERGPGGQEEEISFRGVRVPGREVGGCLPPGFQVRRSAPFGARSYWVLDWNVLSVKAARASPMRKSDPATRMGPSCAEAAAKAAAKVGKIE